MTVNINLLPWRAELKEQQKKEFFTILGAAMCVSAALMLGVHLIVKNQINFQLENNEILNKEIAALDLKIQEIKGLQKEKEQLLARMEIIQQLQTNRPRIVKLFDVIAKTVPEGLMLTSLTRTENRVLLDGKAESNTRVSTFMRNIDKSDTLESPILSLIQAEKKDKGDSWIGFNLQALQETQEQ